MLALFVLYCCCCFQNEVITTTVLDGVSKLVFYAQSTGAVISGRYTSHIVYLIFNNVYVLKWVYIQF